MVVSPAFVPKPAAADLMEPAQGPLHYPPVYTKAATLGLTPLSQQRQDIQPAQRTAQRALMVGAIADGLLWALPLPPSFISHWGYRFGQWHGLGHIVRFGSGQTHSQMHQTGS